MDFYIDTPRTEFNGNATSLTTGYRSAGRTRLSALDSVENSFQTPSKEGEDVIKLAGDARRRRDSAAMFKAGTSRTGSMPKSTRNSSGSLQADHRRQLPPAMSAHGEFTPLMRSATRNNFLRTQAGGSRATGVSAAGVPKTPAYLKPGYRSNGNTPGLPTVDATDIYGDDVTDDQPTPLPQVVSSSAQSTPLPRLAPRDGGGVLDGQNGLTLREQEKAIDKLDKDNFGLKLKIHYLQEQLAKMGPGYQQEALKENTELKVAKMTMLRDIARYKKNLLQAERDLESYRQQLQELRESSRRRENDETARREIALVRDELEARDSQIRELKDEMRTLRDKQGQEVEKLRDDIEDLEASLREKDRILEQREEEIEELKDKDGKEHDAVSELEAELESAKQQMEELHESLQQAQSEAEAAQQAEERALQERSQAQDDLRELQDEMANKSFTTKGLNRQLEERADKLEEEVQKLQAENEDLKSRLDSKTHHGQRLEEQFQKVKNEFNEERRMLSGDLDLARQDCDATRAKHDRLATQLQDALDELQRTSEEKSLLQTRHEALTTESSSLQRELTAAKSTIRELKQAIDEEQQRAADDVHDIRTQYKAEIDRLQEEIGSLQHEIEDKEGQWALNEDKWESTKRTLQVQKEKAEEQAAGFKRTIEKLQQTEQSLSGKESKMQNIIDSEKARHLQEEAVLTRQIKELDDDIVSKRRQMDEQRSELLAVKEELRQARREEQAAKEKVQGLEDEIVILQTSLREEQDYASGRLKQGTSSDILESQLRKANSDKQQIREQLNHAHEELQGLRATVADLEAMRDNLQDQIARNQAVPPSDEGRHLFDREKVDLKKSKMRLEGEVTRLKEEKSSLVRAKEALETQLDSEIERATVEENRLATEIDRLQDKLMAAKSDGKDRELAQASSKVQRLERRVQELESILVTLQQEQEQQQGIGEAETSTVNTDLSLLRQRLDEARKREKALLQRESEHKASIRSCKTRIAELESEVHEALMTKYEGVSPQSSAPAAAAATAAEKLQEELRSLRRQIAESHKTMRELKSKNRALERAALRDEEQRDLNELLKLSTLEAESLALKVSERDARLGELKAQLQRVREERSLGLGELDALQARYDRLVAEGRAESKSSAASAAAADSARSRHDKEIRGLGKEITWLRAKLKREERFRRDLAWSKGLMELGERVRVACNEADLRMIAAMGVKARADVARSSPRRRLKTAMCAVLATVRMQRMSQEWKKTRRLGEGLQRAKSDVLKRRREKDSV